MSSKTQSLYSTIIKHSQKPYENNRVSQILILLRKGVPTSINREALMLELFKLTSPITIKAVNNFFHLIREVPKNKIIHEEEDIASECYLALHRCVGGIKLEYFKKFHFYLNSSYNRTVYRVFERQYKKHQTVVENKEDNEYTIAKQTLYNHHFDLTDMEIERANLTEVELSVLKMRVEGDNFQMFLKSQKMNHIEYKKVLESLKSKMYGLYNTEEK